ncbi:hypothetical protein MMB68_05820 [Priestia sp. Y58]|uniref:hypothetical protein n=1 Tax=Priestia TaxID=2800373 RepID=UPI0024053ECC|nr:MULTISPECIES: hypothetical protein [Priestia]MDG0029080.1 hypothetical protein [Priestia sp. Y58]MDN4862791.1 hypothetical protein [Priestia megaterium]
MTQAGWISIHRKIREHSFFRQKRTFSYFEAWIDLLLSASHKDNTILLNANITSVKRGELITSKKTLGERWEWSNNKVNKFMRILEEDHMAIVKCTSKYTRITLVNYDLYQVTPLKKGDQKHIENTSDRNQTHTFNNVNNSKNTNNGDENNNAEQKKEPNSNYRLYF